MDTGRRVRLVKWQVVGRTEGSQEGLGLGKISRSVRQETTGEDIVLGEVFDCDEALSAKIVHVRMVLGEAPRVGF